MTPVCVGLLLLSVLLVNCAAEPRLGNVDVAHMRRMLAEPDWTADEWEVFCDPEGLGRYHCTLHVAIYCPPDCGRYATLRTDPLVRRLR